jgi:hypothetical protein
MHPPRSSVALGGPEPLPVVILRRPALRLECRATKDLGGGTKATTKHPLPGPSFAALTQDDNLGQFLAGGNIPRGAQRASGFAFGYAATRRAYRSIIALRSWVGMGGRNFQLSTPHPGRVGGFGICNLEFGIPIAIRPLA